MDDAHRSFFTLAFDAGHQAWSRDIPRDQVPVDLALVEVAFWQSGWDCGQREAAMTDGANAEFTDANPYPPVSEAAAYWAKGWRETHRLTALSG